jgi:MSHA pilin protein MshD
MGALVMSSKWARGFTMVEMIIAIVIISVGLAGVLTVLSRTSMFSAEPMATKQMAAIADGMLEEVLQKPFSGDGPTPYTGCDRSGFNEVSDYNNYTNKPVCDITGNPGPAGYTVSVSVTNGTGAILTGGIPAGDTYQVTVTVNKGSDSYTIRGWRTNFGKGQL